MNTFEKYQKRIKSWVRNTKVCKTSAISLNSNEFFFPANSKKLNAVIVSNTERVESIRKGLEIGPIILAGINFNRLMYSSSVDNK